MVCSRIGRFLSLKVLLLAISAYIDIKNGTTWNILRDL